MFFSGGTGAAVSTGRPAVGFRLGFIGVVADRAAPRKRRVQTLEEPVGRPLAASGAAELAAHDNSAATTSQQPKTRRGS